MISYDGLLQKLKSRQLTKTALVAQLGISSRTVAKVGRGERIADHVLALRHCPVHHRGHKKIVLLQGAVRMGAQ